MFKKRPPKNAWSLSFLLCKRIIGHVKDKTTFRKWMAILITVGGFATLLGIWAIVSLCLKSFGNNVLPYPHETFGRAAVFLFGEEAGRTWTNMGWTLARLLIGYGLSFLLAAIFGTLSGLFPMFRRFMSSWIGLAKVIPTAAVVIILIGVFFGPQNRGWQTYIPSALTMVIALPVIYEGFAKGITEEDSDVQDALEMDCGRRNLKSVFYVHWPMIRPYIALSLATSLGMSMKVTVMSEVLTASSSGILGIGGMIMIANQTGTIEDVMAYSWIAVLMMLVMDIPWFIVKFRMKKKV